MEAMRFLKLSLIAALVAILVWAGYSLVRQKNEVNKEILNLSEAAKKIGNENASLQNSIKYLELPENLVKESKARFNYKNNGEQMIIVVPEATDTTVSSSTQ